MIFSFAINTPANTSKESKRKQELKLTRGIIHQVDILFPSGCAGLAHIAINDALHQVWPTNPEEDFYTDGEKISSKEFYNLRREPFMLNAFTWNEDDTFPHSIIVRLSVLQKSEIQGVWIPWEEEELG
jgi:hypothetical protein